MAATTYSNFNGKTEALDVARSFSTNISGKTILVTGVNLNGIGFATSQALASQSPALLIVAGRNVGKIQQGIGALQAEYPNVNYRALVIDLSDQEAVRAAATTVLEWSDVPSIDILVNSAGIMGINERTITKDGIELHFATNHIGHWLFSCLIMPKLITASKRNPAGATRIVNVSSASPKFSGIRWSDMNFEKKNRDLPAAEQPLYDWFKPWGYTDMEDKTYIPLDGYNRSKVANVLFSIGANQRLFEQFGILSVSLHPGILMTELGRNFDKDTKASMLQFLDSDEYRNIIKTLGAGASTTLVAALDSNLAIGVGESKNGVENYGTYLDDCQISEEAHHLAVSGAEAERLWELSEKLVGQIFAW